jgi:hypothetical protein
VVTVVIDELAGAGADSPFRASRSWPVLVVRLLAALAMFAWLASCGAMRA